MDNTAEPEIVEDFYGVYLLYNINPKFKGRTYIGYTRDPNRRIMQHNRGTWAGGAHRTNNRGPWKMVMIVHGFPNNISALRFEWAWQNPSKTTRLQHLDLKKIPRKESEYQFKLRVLSEMLRVGPWCRLPLMVRWLENEYREEFPPERKPPEHIPIIQGPVKSYNRKKNKHITTIPTIKCLLCSGYLKDDEKLRCTNVNCDLVSHLSCLANLFLPPGEYIPIQGNCPFCNTKLKWGDLIRIMNGYDQGVKDLGENDGEVCTQDDGLENYDEWLYDKNGDEGDVLKNKEFVDNFDEDDDIICTQDRLSDDINDAKETVTRNRKFVDNFDEHDDIIVCTQNYNNGDNKVQGYVPDRNFDIDNKGAKQNTEFVNNFNRYDNDVICTQDYNNYGRNNDVIRPRDTEFDNNGSDDEVVCTQDRLLNIFDTGNDVIRINDVKNTGDKNDVSDDSDDEILFIRNKVYDNQPSWFLDCNDNL